ncbi:AI-2E family transporter [Rhodohalobacter sp. SW132]|uniref:AI-2E family transporter n=1 Tax=Rhodohalobacter sp. SW132 TaxID=2293433 RepID=UPI000E24C6FB|nr:AI-2E family transporter [Rhodohalobacter sp. SW132]REL33290.1 AI-2E family transporter [Rhodohalobacter sp. SW132]
MSDIPASAKYLIWLLLAIAIVFLLNVLQHLLVPLLFSILFAYLLYPGARRMENAGIPRILTNLSLIIGALLLIAGIFSLLGFLIANFTEDFSDVKEQIEENAAFFIGSVGNFFGVSEDQMQDAVENIDGLAEYVLEFFTATTNTIVAFGLMPVYTFLLLLYRNKFQTILLDISSDKNRRTVQTIIREIAEIVPRYLKGLIVVVILLMFINSGVFWLIGLDYPILLGVIAALFNLIPYLGTILGYASVLILVLATQDPSLAFWVVVAFFPVQFFENNILTPNITGSYVRMNPLIIILSLLAGAMLWELAGMLLVIPYLAMLKIICDNVDSLKPVGFLLSSNGTEEFMPSLNGVKKWFSSSESHS